MRQKGNKLREPSPLIDTLNSSLIFEELSISFHKQRQIWHQLLEDGENLLSLPGNRYNSPAALKKALHLLNKDVTCSLVEVTIFSSELRVHNNSYCDWHSKMDDTLDSSQRQPYKWAVPRKSELAVMEQRWSLQLLQWYFNLFWSPCFQFLLITAATPSRLNLCLNKPKLLEVIRLWQGRNGKNHRHRMISRFITQVRSYKFSYGHIYWRCLR